MQLRNSHLAVILGVWLALAACSKATQDKTGQDIKAVGSEVGAAAKSVAATPAMKDLGSDIKQGTEEAAAKTKVATDKAGEELKAGAKDAGAKLKAGAKDAGAKTDAALNNAKDKAQH
ncbi:MAG TPA: cell surface protein [Phenylobacterium sp.]|nr:cell surface protein [Phenylobacterium sp.]